MSDEEWESKSFEEKSKKPVISDKWEGEDEDDAVRDNWDDDGEEQERKDETASPEMPAATQVKKKKSLKEKLAEKEEKKRKELEEKRKQEEEARTLLTPKQIQEQKRREQRQQDEEYTAVALESMGIKSDEPAVGVIDGFDPKTRPDFEKFSQILSEKILKFEKSPFYVPFMENLTRDLALGLDSEDLKKIMSTLTALYNEKVKQQKGQKGKKKTTKKATLVMEKNETNVVEDSHYAEEFGDYI